MNYCSWLPHLTQRWCCERPPWKAHLEIKDTVNLCRYSPKVLLSLPTSIWMLLPVNVSQSLMFIYPISFFPVLIVLSFAFCWFQVPMTYSTPKRVNVKCQVYRWAQLISHSNLSNQIKLKTVLSPCLCRLFSFCLFSKKVIGLNWGWAIEQNIYLFVLMLASFQSKLQI